MLTAIKMLNRAMNFLKRKRSDKEENREPVGGEPSQAIVPYGSKVLHPPSNLFFPKLLMMALQWRGQPDNLVMLCKFSVFIDYKRNQFLKK